MTVRLTPRLEMILSLIPAAATYCDIGTDHGYIAVSLAKRGGRVIAADVNKGPLEGAKANIIKYGVSGMVELRLSDGFSALKYGEAECAVIAGMGGELICEILKGGEKGVRYFVLQPQSKQYELRDFLDKNGFCILDEKISREDNRFYVAMLAAKGANRPLSPTEKHIGPKLLENRPPLFNEYLNCRCHEAELVLERMGFSDPHKRAEYESLIKMYREAQCKV